MMTNEVKTLERKIRKLTAGHECCRKETTRHEISLCSVCHCFFLETRLTRLPCNFNSVSLSSIHLLLSLSLLSKRLPYTLVSRVSEQSESTACFCIRNSSQKRNRVVSPLAKFATTGSSIETRTWGQISSRVLLSFFLFPSYLLLPKRKSVLLFCCLFPFYHTQADYLSLQLMMSHATQVPENCTLPLFIAFPKSISSR